MMQFNPPKEQKNNKVSNKKYVYKRLWDYLMRFKWLLVLAFVLTVVANALSLVGPYLAGLTIGAMEGTVNMPRVLFFAGLMIIFYISSAIMMYVLSRVMIHISKSVVFEMRQDVFIKLNKLPIKFYDDNTTGDLISRMSYDIDTINQSLAGDAISLFTSALTIIVSLTVMILTAPLLVLIFAVTIPIAIIMTTVLSKKVKKKFRVRNKMLGELNGYSEEMITGHQTIKSYVLESEVEKTFKTINEKTTLATYEAGYYSTAVMPSVGFISNLSMALVGVFGGLLYATGRMSLEVLTSFTLYSRRFSGPINQLSGLFAEIQSALSAAERVFFILDSEEEPIDSTSAETYELDGGDIAFDDLSFGYDEKTTVLSNISLEAKKGQVIAIVGPTGSGKTTLINLLMRFYDPNKGLIVLDGSPVKSYTRASLRKAFSMILQDSWVFYGTIYDNIRYGNENVTNEDIIEAAKKAQIHDYIVSLELGYDTYINHDGTTLSKGQKQLIVIARALCSKTNMLILDEATSNVDTQTEIKIHHAMKTLMQDKTTFIIAHRLSTIQDADVIMVIKDGRLLEAGNHETLLQQKGFYSNLFLSQFK
jgi:ATP-binding cassette, subfamily B, multidrug efflux pump